jgi:hypothetical protein
MVNIDVVAVRKLFIADWTDSVSPDNLPIQ